MPGAKRIGLRKSVRLEPSPALPYPSNRYLSLLDGKHMAELDGPTSGGTNVFKNDHVIRGMIGKPVMLWLTATIIVLCAAYMGTMLYANPAQRGTIDLSSIVSESSLLVFAIAAILVWSQFEGSRRTRWTIFAGLCFLIFSFATDILDEVIEFSVTVSDWVEGYFEVIAFGLILYGICSWVIEWKGILSDTVRLATTDSLTGAMNRRHFLALAEHLLLLSARHKTPLSMIIVDIDHFKKINDELGHACGDEVLRAFVAEIGKIIRKSDLLCRYGGEEFAVILPDCDLAGARNLAEKMRGQVGTLRTPDGNRISASFGVACLWPEEGIRQIIHRADMALYQAKQSGRNRVALAPNSVNDG